MTCSAVQPRQTSRARNPRRAVCRGRRACQRGPGIGCNVVTPVHRFPKSCAGSGERQRRRGGILHERQRICQPSLGRLRESGRITIPRLANPARGAALAAARWTPARPVSASAVTESAGLQRSERVCERAEPPGRVLCGRSDQIIESAPGRTVADRRSGVPRPPFAARGQQERRRANERSSPRNPERKSLSP